MTTSIKGRSIGYQGPDLGDDAPPAADVQHIAFGCAACGRTFEIPMHEEAVPPAAWSCRCGGIAIPTNERFRGGEVLPALTGRTPREGKTHREMLAERRTDAELEVILAERLAQIRGQEPEQVIALASGGYAECRFCGNVRALRADGLLRNHRDANRNACEGSRQAP